MDLITLGFNFTIISPAQVLPILVGSGSDLNVFTPFLFLFAPFPSLFAKGGRRHRYRIRQHAKSHPREDKEKERDNRSRSGSHSRKSSHEIALLSLITFRFNGPLLREMERENHRVSVSMIHFSLFVAAQLWYHILLFIQPVFN